MPGHHDAANEYTSLEDAERIANLAIEYGLAGLNILWINKLKHFSD